MLHAEGRRRPGLVRRHPGPAHAAAAAAAATATAILLSAALGPELHLGAPVVGDRDPVVGGSLAAPGSEKGGWAAVASALLNPPTPPPIEATWDNTDAGEITGVALSSGNHWRRRLCWQMSPGRWPTPLLASAAEAGTYFVDIWPDHLTHPAHPAPCSSSHCPCDSPICLSSARALCNGEVPLLPPAWASRSRRCAARARPRSGSRGSSGY